MSRAGLFEIMKFVFLCRMGDYKLLVGMAGSYNGWYPPDKLYTEEMVKDPFTFEERLKAGNESYYKLFNLKGDTFYHVCIYMYLILPLTRNSPCNTSFTTVIQLKQNCVSGKIFV